MDERIQRGVIALRQWWAGRRENPNWQWEDAVRAILHAVDSPQLVCSFDLPNEPFSLEIAAGERPTPGYIHHDARQLSDVEIVCDMGDELVELVGQSRLREIRACHVLEHAPYPETVNLLLKWKSMLVAGGAIHIEVPNLAWQVGAMQSGEITPDEFVYYCFGEQNYPGNFHYNGFTLETLSAKLNQAGFTNVEVQDIGQVLIARANKV